MVSVNVGFTIETMSTLGTGNGDRIWKNEAGQLHREDGPAIEWAHGTKEWYIHGKLHREDGPAIEWENGSRTWWIDGQRHRKDGPAVELDSGYKEWWVDGKCHRIDGPAIERANGTKEWYLYGNRHRENGPAIEWANGDREWWLHDKCLSYPTFLTLIVQHHLKLHLLTRVLPTGAESLVQQWNGQTDLCSGIYMETVIGKTVQGICPKFTRQWNRHIGIGNGGFTEFVITTMIFCLNLSNIILNSIW